ncbi:Cpec 0RF663-like protein [Chlamydia pecorum]|uniref:hypothetical protein n=1 Tax=Chlamydia pecorum TaxID=85991 RepID=UPI001E5BA982|nr:hypothetical protein [Chlamydia pecorum]UBV33120.1 Cpec 0RF663-like protein [Chlamydia pecorum]
MSTPVPSYIAEMSKVEDLSPLNTKNPSPWETCKTYFIKRSLICIVLTILLALGSSALACYAVLNNNWYVLGISLSITISSILIALLLAFPIKNKIYGTTLLDEISQDIETVGVQTLQSFEAMLQQIHYTQLPELKQLHRSLLVKRQENVRKQHELKDLETSSSKELSPKEPLPKEPSPKEPSSKEPSSKELSPKEPLPKEPSPKEPSTKEPSTKEPSPKEPSTKEPSTKEPSTKEPSPKEPSTKEPSKFSFKNPFKKSSQLPPLPPESPSPETYNPIPIFGTTTFQTKNFLNNNNKQGDPSESSGIIPLFSDFNLEDDDGDDGILSFDDDVFVEKEPTPPSNYQTFDYEQPRYQNPGFMGNMCKSISQWFKKPRKK